MKRTALLLLMVVSMATANAQHGRFSIGTDLGFPMGDFGKLYDLGFGIPYVRYEHPIGDNIGIGATIGWMIFAGGSSDVDGYTTDVAADLMTQYQLLGKYYFQEQQKGFYGMVEFGYTNNAFASVDNGTGTTSESLSAGGISYAPSVGYCLDHWDFNLRYQMFSMTADVMDETGEVHSESSSNGFLGIRIGFVFGRPE
jgi:hypothetical protein